MFIMNSEGLGNKPVWPSYYSNAFGVTEDHKNRVITAGHCAFRLRGTLFDARHMIPKRGPGYCEVRGLSVVVFS